MIHYASSTPAANPPAGTADQHAPRLAGSRASARRARDQVSPRSRGTTPLQIQSPTAVDRRPTALPEDVCDCIPSAAVCVRVFSSSFSCSWLSLLFSCCRRDRRCLFNSFSFYFLFFFLLLLLLSLLVLFTIVCFLLFVFVVVLFCRRSFSFFPLSCC